MASEYEHASGELGLIAQDCVDQARMCRISRNILLGIGAITEAIIGIVDLAGVDYHSVTISPYIMNGGSWLAAAGIAHFSAKH